MSAEIIKQVCKCIPGMIAEVEGQFLFDLASKCSRGVIVEIGSSAGRSTICLALGSKAGKRMPVYAVDPHNGGGSTPDPSWWDSGAEGTPNAKYYVNQGNSFAQFSENIKKFQVEDVIKPIVNYSELAYEGWSQPIELLFIDGDHRYNYVKMDVSTWGSWLISGGIILLHDSTYTGVRRTIEKLIIKNPKYKDVTELPIFHARLQ